MIKRIGMILSGCEVYDCTEIQEAIITLLTKYHADVNIAAMILTKSKCSSLIF